MKGVQYEEVYAMACLTYKMIRITNSCGTFFFGQKLSGKTFSDLRQVATSIPFETGTSIIVSLNGFNLLVASAFFLYKELSNSSIQSHLTEIDKRYGIVNGNVRPLSVLIIFDTKVSWIRYRWLAPPETAELPTRQLRLVTKPALCFR